MSFQRTFHVAAVASLLWMGLAAAEAASPIAVGQAAPKFELKNQAGDATSLAALVKKKPVALVFYRSADW